MHDNANGNLLITFQDAEWLSPTVGLKVGLRNVSRDNSCGGCILLREAVRTGAPLRIEVSPNWKWINLRSGSEQSDWIYVVQPEDVFTSDRSEDKLLPVGPGDLLHYSFEDSGDPASELIAQFRLTRIAYMDRNGDIITTDAFSQLQLECETAAQADSLGLCCGLCFARSLAPELMQLALRRENRYQTLLLADEQPLSAPEAQSMLTEGCGVSSMPIRDPSAFSKGGARWAMGEGSRQMRMFSAQGGFAEACCMSA